LPQRPQQLQARHACGLGGGVGVVRNDGAEGMGGVDDEIDGIFVDVIDQPVDAAETADTDVARQRRGLGPAPGQRRGDADLLGDGDRHPAGQLAGLGGAAEDQEMLNRHSR